MKAQPQGTTGTYGLDTYLTRVEAWECDHNNHWNTRFYGGAFDEASDVVRAWSPQQTGGSGTVSWHLRFHRELHGGSVATVHSSRIAHGEFAGGLLHVLRSKGAVSATGIMTSALVAPGLPPASEASLALAAPRGLAGCAVDWEGLERDPQSSVPLGLVRERDFDTDGRVRLQELLRLCGRASQDHRDWLGFGQDYAQEEKVAGLLVEMRITLMAGGLCGQPAYMGSRLISVGERTYVSAHRLTSEGGPVMAHIEMCLLAVDMAERRATRMPDFLRERI